MTARLSLLLIIVFLSPECYSQDSARINLKQIPTRYVEKVSAKTGRVQKRIEVKSEKALEHFIVLKAKISGKLTKIDSSAASDIFADLDNKLRTLQQNLEQPGKFSGYIPHLDSIETSLKFLNQNLSWLNIEKNVGQKLEDCFSNIDLLKDKLGKAEEIKQFLKEQNQYLREQLNRIGFAKELKTLNKAVYYYTQQLKEYKEILNNPERLEKKALSILSTTNVFQDFMRKNSLLASLFRLPSNEPTDPVYQASLAGLQTRAQVNNMIQQQIGASGPNAMQQFQQNIQQAQSQIQQLKEKMAGSDAGSSDDMMPGPPGGKAGFKPNNQKTKSFLKRIEYGTNIQTQRANGYFPVTSDIGLSVDYKLNDKSVIGVGASYKLGWGTGWKDIHITQQGAGLRSFLDWQIKGSWWISGGFEMNYKTLFNSIAQLKEFNAWQQSGLIGLSKVVSVKSKLFKKTKVQALWDFLSYQQVPRTQPLLFRIGYSLN